MFDGTFTARVRHMSTVGGIKIDGDETIGRALTIKNLTVPFYQRSYAWEEKHVNDFFQDLSNAIGQKETEYFLGSIVVTQKNSGPADVVDGQQRIATTMILPAALRDHFHQAGDNDRADGIERPFLIDRDFKTGTPIPKLIMNEIDRDYFTNRVLLRPDASERKAAVDQKLVKDSHKLIDGAARLAKQHVQSLLNQRAGAQAQTELLSDWRDFIKIGTRVIWVTVKDEANAYVMFETLNDRGLELSKADLLKNFLLSKSGDRVREVLHRWISMQSALETGGEEENLLVTYIRHFWSSLYGLTRERELYATIKVKIKTAPEAFKLANELSEQALPYAAILSASHGFWGDYGDAFKSVRTLNQFRLKQIRPLLMAIVTKLGNKQVEKCLRLLVRCSVRFLIVGGLGGGQIEENYTKAANEITAGNIQTANQLLDFLKRVTPKDPEFTSAFTSARVSQPHLARYYLRAMEQQLDGDPEPQWMPSDEKGITLEHILPQSPSDEWNIEPDVIETYGNRLGNLALLQKRINKQIANGPFLDKRQHYEQSKFALTNELKGYDSWRPEEINDRQKRLAELAVKTWPLKV